MKTNYNKVINSNIELLRVIGILTLVLYHIGCMETGQNSIERFVFFISQKSWIGTDLFLVIAGYFFYSSFTNKYNNNPVLYLKNRTLRIVPFYYIFLTLYFLFGIKIENLVGNHFSIQDGYWLYFYTFTANLPMAFGNWSGAALEGLFGISLLVQLFILFSILFSIFKRQKHRTILIISMEAVIFIIRFHPVIREKDWFSYFFTFTRMDGFLMGIMIAILRTSEKWKFLLEKRKNHLLLITILLLTALAPLSGWLETTHPLTSCIIFPVIALFFSSVLNFVLTLRCPAWSINAGNFVYSLYIVKLPLIYIVKGYLNNINTSLNKPVFFLFLSFGICLIWSLIFQMICNIPGKLRNRVT